VSAAAQIEIAGIVKHYEGGAALRIDRLSVRAGDRISLSGLDAAGAELLVNLITGAAVPEQGDVRVAGRSTRDIATDTEWLASLDRFGIVTSRAVLLEGMTIAANLALPLTVAIDPMSDAIRAQVEALAREVGLAADRLDAPAGGMTPEERVRLHLARALAPNPEVLLLEHPTAALDEMAAAALGTTLQAVASSRRVGWVAVSDDERFMRAAGGTRLRLGRGGRLTRDRFWRRMLA
jgi:ABC-type lipoprotein export system ATPase subunit